MTIHTSSNSQPILQLAKRGEALDIDRLIDPAKRHVIEAAMAELGHDYLGPVKERLGDDYSYDELRYVRAWLTARIARTG